MKGVALFGWVVAKDDGEQQTKNEETDRKNIATTRRKAARSANTILYCRLVVMWDRGFERFNHDTCIILYHESTI
jgi:hypothetical protein